MSKSLVKTKNNKDNDLLEKIGEKIVTAESAQEVVLYTQVRGEILQQDLDYNKEAQIADDEAEDKALKRFEIKSTLIFKMALSPIAIALGCLLLYLGFTYAGLLCIGAGLWLLASEFVKGYLLGGGKQ